MFSYFERFTTTFQVYSPERREVPVGVLAIPISLQKASLLRFSDRPQHPHPPPADARDVGGAAERAPLGGTPPLLWGLSSRTSFAGTVFFVRLVDLCLLGKGITACAERRRKLLGDVSSSVIRGGLLLPPTGNLLSTGGHFSAARLHCDLFGSWKINEHPQSTDRVVFCAQRRCRGWAVPSVLQPFEKLYLDQQKGDLLLRVAGDRFKNKAEVFSLHMDCRPARSTR